MTKRSNYDRPLKLVKERRVVKALTGEHDEANGAVAIAKSELYDIYIQTLADNVQQETRRFEEAADRISVSLIIS